MASSKVGCWAVMGMWTLLALVTLCCLRLDLRRDPAAAAAAAFTDIIIRVLSALNLTFRLLLRFVWLLERMDWVGEIELVSAAAAESAAAVMSDIVSVPEVPTLAAMSFKSCPNDVLSVLPGTGAT